MNTKQSALKDRIIAIKEMYGSPNEFLAKKANIKVTAIDAFLNEDKPLTKGNYTKLYRCAYLMKVRYNIKPSFWELEDKETVSEKWKFFMDIVDHLKLAYRYKDEYFAKSMCKNMSDSNDFDNNKAERMADYYEFLKRGEAGELLEDDYELMAAITYMNDEVGTHNRYE